TRLKPNGYLSQWLPAYQVPVETTLAMVRSFIDVFPQAVLISGAEADLLLLGTSAHTIEIDPVHLVQALSRRPKVQADLHRLDLGGAREIVGTFVGSAHTLAAATRDHAPVTDDYPRPEYAVKLLVDFGEVVPSALVDLDDVKTWCPKCFVGRPPAPPVEGLDTYVALLGRAYVAPATDVLKARELAERTGRVIAGSAY